MNSGIYAIEAPNGARYIGSAVHLERRRREHFSGLRRGNHRNNRLQVAYRKHGEALNFRTLMLCRPEDLVFFEQRAINVYSPGYNIALVAGSSLGTKRSDDYKSAKSKAMTGRKDTAETCERKRQALLGRPVSKETRKKLAEQKGWKHTGNAKLKMRGRTVSESVRAKSSKLHRGNQYRKGAIVPAETRARISQKLAGRKRSPESVAKQRATLATRRQTRLLEGAST